MAGICEACGQAGQPCCGFPSLFSCGETSICSDGTCQACGQAGQPCCTGSPFGPCGIGPFTQCSDGTCEACGSVGQPCCVNFEPDFCLSPGECDGNTTCTGCGLGAQPSCTPTATGTATPTRTPTATPTATPTDTPKPNGADCSTPSVCASGFCVDGVCCNSACDDLLERCDGLQPGICTSLAAPVPALSWKGLLVAALALVATATVALWKRRRAGS